MVLLSSCGRNDGASGRAGLPPEGVIQLSDQFHADFKLVNQDGAQVSNEDLKGKTLFVYFGYSSCPDVCPLALGRMSAALNELTADEQKRVDAIFVTVDPDRDTPEKLKGYLAFDPRIMGLSGDRAAVEKAMDGFKVYAQAQQVENSSLGYEVQHSSLFYLVDPDGGLRFALEDSLDGAAIAAAIRQSLKRSK